MNSCPSLPLALLPLLRFVFLRRNTSKSPHDVVANRSDSCLRPLSSSAAFESSQSPLTPPHRPTPAAFNSTARIDSERSRPGTLQSSRQRRRSRTRRAPAGEAATQLAVHANCIEVLGTS
ncbi:hypothetical protein B0H16DRAFT_326052 [Mycena metata]|uniref:Secreted protein n=1 Tax=Mycena metata TaxID=1033252 RepID=A0AAD7HMW5_9AGAR|nr:hypothetical protein B0H16DRAFT_326052 [Mycena metata]